MTIGQALAEVSNVQLPLTWVLGIVGSLATTVTILAKILWDFVTAQIKEMRAQMKRLQRRIDVLQRGCGVAVCAWRVRGAPEEGEDEEG